MKNVKKLIASVIAMLAMFAAPTLQAEPTSFEVLSTKAERFYDQKDWNSALAMFELMLSQRPQETAIYSKAIAAAGMSNKQGEQNALLAQALRQQTPIDSLFKGVEQAGMALGATNMYEQFLLNAREANPWLSRNIDSYLLKYYSFRRNGEKIIEYARIMLKGEPDSETFRYALAQGYMTEGLIEEAKQEYREILNRNPEAIQALLYLGNLEEAAGNRDGALELMKRAYALRPTPHVAATIKKLEPASNQRDKLF